MRHAPVVRAALAFTLGACGMDLDAGTRITRGDDAAPAAAPVVDAGQGPVSDGASSPTQDARPRDGAANREGTDALVTWRDAGPITPRETPLNDGEGELVVGRDSYLPLGPGFSWTYLVKPGKPSAPPYTKQQVVELRERLGPGPHEGKIAFRLRTTKPSDDYDDIEQSLSWQAHEGTAVVRYQERSFRRGAATNEESWTPSKLRVDGAPARTTPGASWTERLVERQQRDGTVTESPEALVWQVVATDEEVTVPAGTFRCLHLTSTDVPPAGSQTPPATKHWWFAKGVGKVKEIGKSTEELIHVSLVLRRKD